MGRLWPKTCQTPHIVHNAILANSEEPAGPTVVNKVRFPGSVADLAVDDPLAAIAGLDPLKDAVNLFGSATGGTNTRRITTPIDYALTFYGTWTSDPWP